MNCENQLFFKFLIQEGFEETTSRHHKQSYYEIIEGRYNPFVHQRTFERRGLIFFFDTKILTVNNNGKFLMLCHICSSLDKRYLDIPSSIMEIISNPNRYISPKIRKLIFELYKYTCVFCGSKDNLEIDHKIPVSLGGSGDYDNLQVLCKPCNIKKSNKL